MDRAKAKMLNESFREMVADWATANGVELSKHSCRFTDTDIRMTLTLLDTDPTACESREDRDHMTADLLGLKKRIGDRFVSARNDETFVITGVVARRPKFPVSATRVRDGKSFKFPVVTVNAAKSVD